MPHSSTFRSLLVALVVVQNGGEGASSARPAVTGPATSEAGERRASPSAGAPANEAARREGRARPVFATTAPRAGAFDALDVSDAGLARAARPSSLGAADPADDRQACASPERRRQLQGKIDPAVIRAATEHLDLPMGAGRFLSVNGQPYLFCLEPHYREPGSGPGPQGWHKGVTVFDAT